MIRTLLKPKKERDNQKSLNYSKKVKLIEFFLRSFASPTLSLFLTLKFLTANNQKDKEKNEYVFSAADNGIGMEPQYAERIFVIFRRLHTIDEYKGTGIGLSIAKRIVEHHGCRI